MNRHDTNYITKHLGSITLRYIYAYVCSFFKHSPRGKKILVVKLDAVGDQVISSFLMGYLREKFGQYSITILVQTQVEEFYKNCPYIDRITTVDKNQFFRNARYAIREIHRIRKERFSVVIHYVHSRDPAGEQMATASGARRIIGLSGDTGNEPLFLKELYDRRYTEIVPECVPPSEFEGHRYLSIPRHLGFEVRVSDWKPMAWIHETDRAAAQRMLEEMGFKEKEFVLLAPGAGDRMRCWSAKGFSDVGDRLRGEKDLPCLIVGAPGEEDIANEVVSGMRVPCRSVAGKTSIPLLAALSAAAAIVVGNESAPIHLALAAGTPAVAIMGGGHYGRFLPYPGDWPLRCVTHREECFGCDWVCIRSEATCITRVTPEEVFDAAVSLLRGSIR